FFSSRRRHTRSKRDWSSDVCSSDLWLCDLVGYGPGGFGVLTSGGVMANFMALALARDVHLTRLLEAPGPPRGRALEGVRVYASRSEERRVGKECRGGWGAWRWEKEW